MTKKTFKIEYRDPETNELKSVIEEFEDTSGLGMLNISAKEWAEDYGYALADKGWFQITEVQK